MDRTVWLPWAWGAGAVICGLLLCLLHPWRGQFRTARAACRNNSRLWIVPVLAMAGEFVWEWSAPARSAGPLLSGAALQSGDSLAKVLTWIIRGDVLAMVLAAGFLANSAGLRRGMWNGIESVLPRRWRRALQLALLASATAALGIPAVRFGAGGEPGWLTVKILAALWTSTSAALLACWLTLSFESICRSPSGFSKIRWGEMTGYHVVRWWLPVFAGTVAFPLIDMTGSHVHEVLRFYAWPAAALLAWFPLAALRSPDAGEIHTVLGVALRRWAAGFLPFTGWVVAAGLHFFAFHVLGRWVMSRCPDGSWWLAGTGFILHAAWAAIAVWMLGAWIAIQVDRVPPIKKNARLPRQSAP